MASLLPGHWKYQTLHQKSHVWMVIRDQKEMCEMTGGTVRQHPNLLPVPPQRGKMMSLALLPVQATKGQSDHWPILEQK